MLLTLNAACAAPWLTSAPKGRTRPLTILDLPVYAKENLGLAGLSLPTNLLAGFDRQRIEQLRERADKAGCAVLLIYEPEPQAFADPTLADGAINRMKRVVQAAHVLGCNAAAVKVKAADSPAELDAAAKRIRMVSEPAEKMDISLLISPHTGLTSTPERVTDLIKKVGGFRVGTFPDFQAAAASKDPTAYLRRITPYASSVCASTVAFKEGTPPVHTAYDLNLMVQAVLSVGYDAALTIDYRGPGDSTLGVTQTRDALLAALKLDEVGPTDEELADLEAELGEDDEEDEAT